MGSLQGSRQGRSATLIGVVVAAAIVFALSIGLLAGCSSEGAPGGQGAPGGSEASELSESATGPGNSADPQAAKEVWVRQTIDAMTLEQKVAQLFIIRPEELTGFDAVTEAGTTTKHSLVEYPVGGLIYFQQNLVGEDQTRALLADTQQMAQEISGIPIFLGVDEEGGDVVRIAGQTGFSVADVGSMQAIGATGDADKAYEVGVTLGTYLSDLGFNLDFAPVADVASTSDSFMAGRSFGGDVDTVSAMVAAEVEGFAETRTLCAVKHFPGLGSLSANTDFEISTSEQAMDDFLAADVKPFQTGIEAGVPIVMVGHVLTPQATNDALPASLSREWVDDVLRTQLGFDGIVVTDALETPAVRQAVGDDRVGVAVLQAGGDMILIPMDFRAAYQGVLDAVASGELTEERIDESLVRILSVKYDLLS